MTDKSREAFEAGYRKIAAQTLSNEPFDEAWFDRQANEDYVLDAMQSRWLGYRQAALLGVQPEPDKGPWHVNTWTDGRVVLQFDDFTHDVALVIDGDFGIALTKQAYGRNLADFLNAALSSSAPSEGASTSYEEIRKVMLDAIQAGLTPLGVLAALDAHFYTTPV